MSNGCAQTLLSPSSRYDITSGADLADGMLLKKKKKISISGSGKINLLSGLEYLFQE